VAGQQRPDPPLAGVLGRALQGRVILAGVGII
jgi:hypothetical protein